MFLLNKLIRFEGMIKKCNQLRETAKSDTAKYQPYHQVKLINMNTLQLKKYYLLVKKQQQNKLI